MALKIVKCGTVVITSIGKIEGIITAVSIRFEAVAYELSYFNNGEYKQVWLNETEFEKTGIKKISIGFNP